MLQPKTYTRLSPLIILITLLLALGISLPVLKQQQLHIPFFPNVTSNLWLIEAQLNFTGKNRPAKISLYLPDSSPNTEILDESFISRAYGLAVLSEGDEPKKATWTRRRAPNEQQALYYRAQLHHLEKQGRLHGEYGQTIPQFPRIPEYREPLASAIASTLEQARTQSADILSFTNQLLSILADPRNPNSRVIRNSIGPNGWPKLITEILAGARIPSRVVYGLKLEKTTHRPLIPWLEVHDGKKWHGFNVKNGDIGYPKRFFIWSYNSPNPFSSRGVKNIELSFSVTPRQISQIDLSGYYQENAINSWPGLSLEKLPVETQNLYTLLLVLPAGALLVAFMRVVIGVPTFGTFMPILVALAFRETQLLWGIILFLIIVFVGLTLRMALANLRLLLVPRLAGMLVIVVLIMLLLTLLSNELGLESGLSIGLFPMVIMTLMIERMSIVWDERGAHETFKETAGTLLVAILGFHVMNNDYLVHLMQYFPELLLLILAGCLLLGAYNGYRLTELFRFIDLTKIKSLKHDREVDKH